MIGVQTVIIIKSDSSVYGMLGCSSGPEHHWQRNWWVVSTSLRMCAPCKRWTLWATFVIITISIQPYEWNFLFFFDKYDTSFNFILQFYNKFELLNSQSVATLFKVWWKIIHGFCWKFPSLSSGKTILKIHWDLTKLPPCV